MSQAQVAEHGGMTLAEWGDMGEDEPGELVDGQLVEEEEAGAEHDIALWAKLDDLEAEGGEPETR